MDLNVLATLEEYEVMTKEERCIYFQSFTNHDVMKFDPTERHRFYLMKEGFSSGHIKMVLQDVFNRTITPSVNSLFGWRE